MRAVGLILSSVLALAGDSGTGGRDLGWVVACEALTSEDVAREHAEELKELLLDDAGHLWIPGWPSLSGQEAWLVYAGPYDEESEAAGVACALLWRHPDAYCIHVDAIPERRTSPTTPRNTGDFLGLIPLPMGLRMPPGIYFPGEGWEVARSLIEAGDVEEWEQPVRLDINHGDWEITIWMDSYAGPAELRAIYAPGSEGEVEREFQRIAGFVSEHASRLGLELDQHEGLLLLAREEDDPEARLSNRDFWVYSHGNSLEVGYTVRSFFGNPLYCWDFLPDEAHENPFPPSAQLDHVVARIAGLRSSENLYPWARETDLVYVVQFADGLEPTAPRLFVDITVRERHTEENGGDPATAPVVDRFRVYLLSNEILWVDPLTGEYESIDAMLRYRQ